MNSARKQGLVASCWPSRVQRTHKYSFASLLRWCNANNRGHEAGYERLIAWAKSDMAKAPSGKVGAVTLPDGLNWYAEALYDHTTTDLTADEIHTLGLSEVDRIHGEMDKLAQSVGSKDRAAFLADRSEKQDLVLPVTDVGRAEYLRLANAAIVSAREKAPMLFGNLSKHTMVVQREPALSEVPVGRLTRSPPRLMAQSREWFSSIC